MADTRLSTPKVFAKRYAGREAFWMDNRKTRHPRGCNVRNGKPLKQLANMNKHRRQKQHRRALAASQQPPTTHLCQLYYLHHLLWVHMAP